MNKKQKQKNKLIRLNTRYIQWLGFLVILFVVMFAYITVLFEPKEVILDIVYFVLFALLIVGIFFEFKNQMSSVDKIMFKLEEVIAIFIGTFLTYSLVHFFEFNVIISASLVGLIGYVGLRKYEIPLYCGAFAGMVSISMFTFFEVLILAIVCSMIYTLSKQIFKGFGGKLGTIAFLSSLIVHSIFGDEFLTLQIELNIFLLILTTTLGVLITFYLQHSLKLSAVFASSVPSLLFALIFVLFIPNHVDYIVVFFSASFIGMSSKERLPNLFSVILSGIILGLIYEIFIEFFNGLGGKLGLMAMISMIISTGVINTFMKKQIKSKI